MSLYDDLNKEESERFAKFRSYDDECFVFSGELLDEVRARLGWPENSLGRLKHDPNDVPDGCSSSMHGGWFDEKRRLCFWTYAKLSRSTIQWITTIWRDGGAWYVEFGDDNAVKVDRGDKSTARPLADNVVEAMRAHLERVYPKARLA